MGKNKRLFMPHKSGANTTTNEGSTPSKYNSIAVSSTKSQQKSVAAMMNEKADNNSKSPVKENSSSGIKTLTASKAYPEGLPNLVQDNPVKN